MQISFAKKHFAINVTLGRVMDSLQNLGLLRLINLEI